MKADLRDLLEVLVGLFLMGAIVGGFVLLLTVVR